MIQYRRYLELAVVASVIGIVSIYVARSLETTRPLVEEARFQADVAMLRIGLLDVVVQRERSGGELPVSDNPIEWVADVPANYVGVFGTVPEQASVWFFDPIRRQLIYRFQDGRLARFHLSRQGGVSDGRIGLAGVSLQRLPDSEGRCVSGARACGNLVSWRVGDAKP